MKAIARSANIATCCISSAALQSDRRAQACVVPVTEKRYAVVVPSAT